MVIFVETSRVICLIASPVRGNHSLLLVFDTCRQGDLTVNLRVGRARWVKYRDGHLGSSRCLARRVLPADQASARRGPPCSAAELWLLSVSRP
jgi:hypothetical protein